LACDEVEAVLNLTIHTAHAEVTRNPLDAGKHVHSEKPLATNRAEAAALLDLAERKGLLLGCSPFVILGEAQQTLWKAVRDGMIGQPLEAMGHSMHGRVERHNPSADAFLGPGAGPTLDVGCYPLNVLTSIFGPVRRVRGASADILIPDRVFGAGPRQGQTFKVTVPDHATGLLEFATGLPGRLTASFTIDAATLPGIEIYGTEGSLTMAHSYPFDAEVKFRGLDDKDWRPVPHVAPPSAGVDWSRGLVDMFDALRNGTPLHCTGQQALHILDICLTILESAEEGRAKSLTTTFAPSPPMCA
jgi:predicted dehydrogenase